MSTGKNSPSKGSKQGKCKGCKTCRFRQMLQEQSSKNNLSVRPIIVKNEVTS